MPTFFSFTLDTYRRQTLPTHGEVLTALHSAHRQQQLHWLREGGAAKLLELPATTLESRIKRMGLTRPS